jgi:hypothetical protein
MYEYFWLVFKSFQNITSIIKNNEFPDVENWSPTTERSPYGLPITNYTFFSGVSSPSLAPSLNSLIPLPMTLINSVIFFPPKS